MAGRGEGSCVSPGTVCFQSLLSQYSSDRHAAGWVLIPGGNHYRADRGGALQAEWVAGGGDSDPYGSQNALNLLSGIKLKGGVVVRGTARGQEEKDQADKVNVS